MADVHSPPSQRVLSASAEESHRVLTLVSRVAQRTFTALDRKANDCPSTAVARAVRCASAHLGDGASLSDMARASGLSKFYFLRKFRSETGLTPGAFVQRYRVSAAMDMLVASPTPIKDIALRVGYTDYSAFSRAFHKTTGTTPSLYRLTRSPALRPPLSKRDDRAAG